MKIYSLEFSCGEYGDVERVWHTNRRALERYSSELRREAFKVCGISEFELPLPVTEARLVAFLNDHCAGQMPRVNRRHPSIGNGEAQPKLGPYS